MFRQTLALIKQFSYVLSDPPRAEWAMFSFLMYSFKLCKRVLTKELLNDLMKCGVGTNEVEKCVESLSKSSVRKTRNTRMIKFIMGEKLLDAKIEEKRVRREYEKKRAAFNRVIPIGSEIDTWFRILLRIETGKVWEEGKIKNRNKVHMLIGRYRPKENMEEEIRNIKYSDVELDSIEKDRDTEDQQASTKPRMYGGVEVHQNISSILSKDPNFMLLDRIDKTDIEVEIEKGLAKARYELMDHDSDDEGEGEDEIDRGEKVDDGKRGHLKTPVDKTLNYAAMRATEIPTVARLCPPRPSTIEKEKVLGKVKDRLLETVSVYQSQYCDKNGKIKDQNITKTEERAMKEVKESMKKKDIVVFTTDKSGRFSVDTPENYEEAVMSHTRNDTEIEEERVRKLENRMNQHMKIFNKMFQVGSENEHEKRVEMATHSTNTPAPPLYGLRKDHKTAEDDVKGPPVRPVCGASQAPNSRLGHFLSTIVNDFADAANIGTECRSSEEMRAAFEKFNDEERPEEKKQCEVISMDVKALYPSMEWEEVITSVKELIENSQEEAKNVDYEEVGRYLAVTMDKDRIVNEGLSHVIPERKVETGRAITVAYLCNKSNEEKWKNARKPGKQQKKRMVALAVAEGVRACMSHHVYRVGDKTFLQQGGGPIGLELTGAVSRAFMHRWDKLYLEKVRRSGVKMKMYERYVDDSNQIAIVPPPGSVFDAEENKVVVDPQKDDQDLPGDERLAKLLLDIANSVMGCIQMEGDWPSKNRDKKMPILDMKVWKDQEEGTILYQHYEKSVSKKTVINAKSAHSAACKRGVHTQEIIRRLLNTSHRLSWDKETAPVVTEYMRRMRTAGYSEKYRKEVLQHALRIFDKKWMDHREGIQPIFRHKRWKKEERKMAKASKKLNWAKGDGHIAPIFVPTTPGGKLMKMMRKVAEEEAKEGIRFKIMEVGGRTMKKVLQKSNPTATPGCDKDDCLGCIPERGKGGNCRRNNINYEIECQLCPEGRSPVYIGETSRNLYTRAREHADGERRAPEEEGESSYFMRRHMEEYHGDTEMQSCFRARVVRTNTDSFSRQIREGVLIRRANRETMNSKSEWFQPPIFQVRSEIVRE